MEYSKTFHHRSKEHGAGRWADASAQQVGATIDYKTYPGAAVVSLPRPDVACGLSDAIRKRKSSHRDGGPLSLDDIGTLLGWGAGITKRKVSRDGTLRAYHRAQPSGGARYPVELYLLNFADGALARGVYHYRIREHVLECVFDGGVLAASRDLFLYDWIERSSAVLIMTGVFDRTQAKYGERGLRYLYLEAGHIGQNLSLVAAARHLHITMLGGTNDRAVEALLDIDGITESVIYSAAVSKPVGG